MDKNVAIFLLFSVILFTCGSVEGSMVRLVSSCTTKSGIGRCTIEPSSCQDLGGVIESELTFNDGSKALNACANDEACCMLSTIPASDTCSTCGKKGTDRLVRRTNLERAANNLDVPALGNSIRNRLRVLRQVPVRGEEGENEMNWEGSWRTDMEGRILNGDNAEKNEWCWQVALLNIDGTVIGSGSLIDGRYVVTAAHKVAGRNSSNLVVLIGQYDFSQPVNGDKNSTVWYAKPLEIITHERYNSDTLDNNIALIRIPPVSCDSANVCPVCLNELTDPRDMTGLSNCYITGWGASIRRDASPILQEARVRIITSEDCSARFSALGLSDLRVPVSSFCADTMRDWSVKPEAAGGQSSPIISTCTGDGGGPLVCEGADGRWRLFGLIAMGLDDCKQTRIAAPTVFVNVGMYVDWVKGAVERRTSKLASQLDAVNQNQAVGNDNSKDSRKPKAVDSELGGETATVRPRTKWHRASTTPGVVGVAVPERSVFSRAG